MDIFEKESIQQQALEIQQPGDDFDPNVSPQNGEEYLMHMLYERNRCPAVVTKYPKIIKQLSEQSTNMEIASKEIPSSMLPHGNSRPTEEWKTMQAEEFLRSRSRIMMLRVHLSNNNYNVNLEYPLISDKSKWMRFCKENYPNLRIMLRLTQRRLRQLLEMLSEWLIKSMEQNETSNNLTSVTSSTDAANNGEDCEMVDAEDTCIDIRSLGCWIYAVMACLETPLIPDLHSTLRDIARTCIALRHALAGDSFEAAVPYNLLIYLVAHVFNQSDFLEYV